MPLNILYESWKKCWNGKKGEQNPKKGIRESSWLEGKKDWTHSHHVVDDERSRKEFHSSCHICAALTREKARILEEDALRKKPLFLL